MFRIKNQRIKETGFLIIALFAYAIFLIFGTLPFSANVEAATLDDTVSINQNNDPTNVKAQSLQQWRDEHCARYEDKVIAGQSGGYNARAVCNDAYTKGYVDGVADSTDRDRACEDTGKGRTVCKNSYDAGALLQKSEARAATQHSDDDINSEATTFCSGKSNTKPSSGGHAGANSSKLSPRENCVKGFKAGAKGQDKSTACGGSSDCEEGYNAGDRFSQGKNPSGSSSGSSSNIDSADCNPAFGLGWIACSASEFMANFAKDIFESVIGPMLENVPVSLERDRNNPESGSFRAWQAIRVIANTLLVVSLLAVVYSQAKGGE